jgi:hypothetical protein
MEHAATTLARYLAFRAAREGVTCELGRAWFLAQLVAGVRLFFGIEVLECKGSLVVARDIQNPQAFHAFQQRVNGV